LPRPHANASTLVERKPEAAQQHPLERKIEGTAQCPNGLMVTLDQLAAQLRMKWRDGRLSECPHTATEPIPRLEHTHRRAERTEFVSCRQPCQSGAGDHDLGAA
jgi:hypothetical protein